MAIQDRLVPGRKILRLAETGKANSIFFKIGVVSVSILTVVMELVELRPKTSPATLPYSYSQPFPTTS